MMKKFTRYCSVALCLGAVLLLSSTCFAQALPFLGAGSSAAYNAFAIGGASGTTPVCTNVPNGSTLANSTNIFYWTESSGAHSLQGLDGRSASLEAQNAKGWVEWATGTNNSTDPPTAVCVYLAVDSIVGNRLFFATNTGGTPAGSINFPGGCGSAYPVGGQIPTGILPAESQLPTGVCSALQGKTFNAAPSDIRAEDALFGTQRACATYAASGTGFGYSCTLTGTPSDVLSGVGASTGKVQTLNYAISGQDPLSNVQIAHSTVGTDGHPWVSLDAGGQALLVLVNTADTSSTGFGTPSLVNINRPDLARVFTGGATRTRDVIGGSGLASKASTVLVREPLSGTFNTFEFQVTRTLEWNHTQEDLTNNSGGLIANGIGITAPTGWANENGGTTGNPLDWKKTSTGGLKVRVIGTGEMVSTVASTTAKDIGGTTLANQIGYAFFSFGNVKGAVGAAKYLLVDGVDPLFDGASGSTQNPGGVGALPLCTAPCPSGVTLTNIKNGSYPIWNILRVITTGPLGGFTATNGVITGCVTGATVCQLVLNSQNSFAPIPDLVPMSEMEAFRSHSAFAAGGSPAVTFPPHNGFKHYAAGVVNTPCGFAPVTGATVQYQCGSDVGGSRFLIQQELDYNTDAAAELTTFKQ